MKKLLAAAATVPVLQVLASARSAATDQLETRACRRRRSPSRTASCRLLAPCAFSPHLKNTYASVVRSGKARIS